MKLADTMDSFFQAEVLGFFFLSFIYRFKSIMYEGAMFWLANTTPSDPCEPSLPYSSGENPACVLCVRVCMTVRCFLSRMTF